MINFIIGEVKEKTEKSVVLERGGIGFELLVSQQTLKTLPALKRQAKLFTFLRFKAQEGEVELYGFASKEEKHLFELLINVDKIGPKTALNILSAAPVKKLQLAISSKKIEFLTDIIGLTEKTANRIVIELAKKVSNLSRAADLLDMDVQLEEALLSLGFSKKEVRKAIEQLDVYNRDYGDLGLRLKKALKVLKKS